MEPIDLDAILSLEWLEDLRLPFQLSSPHTLWLQALAVVVISLLAYQITSRLIPEFSASFIAKGLSGRDMGSNDKDRVLPESMGVIAGCVFLILMFLFIPVPFISSIRLAPLSDEKAGKPFRNWFPIALDLEVGENFPHSELAAQISALLSICCMLFLGFADDVLDLRWRHKLLLPTLASLPLLMVYGINSNLTTVILPKPVRHLLGTSVWLGPLYYVYMGMLSVFCTNAINIMAGINGLEVGQSCVIAASVISYNVFEIYTHPGNVDHIKIQLFSLSFLLPFLAVSLALYRYNKYPARVFVGDTYCYFAGMTFAVVAILGHFSKTMLLFFIPQIFNFIFSCPQLFRLVPCPRHRLPKFDPKTNQRLPSSVTFDRSDIRLPGTTVLWLFHKLRLVHIERHPVESHNNGPARRSRRGKTSNDISGDAVQSDQNDNSQQEQFTCTNLTLINLWLVWFGPKHEARLTSQLLQLQVACSCLAYLIRYGISQLIY